MAGVKVELLDVQRKIATETTTNETGEFLFTPVRIGHYELRASKEGFSTLVRSNLTLEVQQRMRADLALAVGTIGQSVEVRSESPLLETGTSSVGQVIGHKSIAHGGRPAATLLWLLCPGRLAGGAEAELEPGIPLGPGFAVLGPSRPDVKFRQHARGSELRQADAGGSERGLDTGPGVDAVPQDGFRAAGGYGLQGDEQGRDTVGIRHLR
jgi:hypothetical protein